MPLRAMPLRVGLLECDHVPPHLLPIAGSYADMYRRLFADQVPQLEIVTYDVVRDAFPTDPDDEAAWIIPGSRWSVYDDVPWIADLLEFISAAHEGGRPLVGICFGHQAIAQALGGRAVRAEAGWGVGVHEIEVIEREPWMDPPADRLQFVMSHQDQVVDVPPRASVLARSRHCPIWMARVGETSLGIQGHPEYSAAYASALLDLREDRIPPDVVVAARATLSDNTDSGTVARWIARFLAERA